MLTELEKQIALITEECRLKKLAVLPATEIKCLDKGFVEIIDWLGNDHDLAETARTSYQKGTDKSSNDPNLISRLIRKQHTSPIEQGTLRFKVKAPIFVIIQWLRHRTSQFSSFNSESGRYSELVDEFYLPEISRVQAQSTTNKQGSGDQLPEEVAKQVLFFMQAAQEADYKYYETNLKANISRELARINMPLSTYMSFIWKVDLHNLFNFLRLRLESDAQYEIRVFADAIYSLTKPIYPIACKYFEEHIYHAVTFSKTEFDLVKGVMQGYEEFVIENNLNDNLKQLAEKKGLKSTRLNDFLNLFDLNNGGSNGK